MKLPPQSRGPAKQETLLEYQSNPDDAWKEGPELCFTGGLASIVVGSGASVSHTLEALEGCTDALVVVSFEPAIVKATPSAVAGGINVFSNEEARTHFFNA